MAKIFLFFRLGCIIFMFSIFCTSCTSSASSIETETSNDRIIGTWYYGSNKGGILYHFSSSGQGREMFLDQSSGFKLLYLPFEYTLTTKTIKRITHVQGLKAEENKQYEMLTSRGQQGLKIINYTDGFSPVLTKQDSTPVEGIWQRKNDNGDVIEYILSGGILTKVQNGRPFAFGRLDVSGTTLKLTEQARFIEMGGRQAWIPSTVAPENFQYQLTGNNLLLTAGGSQVIWIRQ